MDLFEGHYLPAGTDIDAIIHHGDERELLALWKTYHHVQVERHVLARIRDDDNPAYEGTQATGAECRRIFTERLAKVADVTPAHALTASRRLVELFTGRRWFVMRDAREAGDSWSAVGSALDMTARDARDWYENKINAQETYVPSHDAERARAVLHEEDGTRATP